MFVGKIPEVNRHFFHWESRDKFLIYVSSHVNTWFSIWYNKHSSLFNICMKLLTLTLSVNSFMILGVIHGRYEIFNDTKRIWIQLNLAIAATCGSLKKCPLQPGVRYIQVWIIWAKERQQKWRWRIFFFIRS